MTGSQEPADGGVPFDTSRAHMARVYDFWLGGKDNFAADRAVAEQVAAAYPDVLVAVRAQRAAPASRVVYADNDPIVQRYNAQAAAPVAARTRAEVCGFFAGRGRTETLT